MPKDKQRTVKPISLAPLPFEEALSDLLKTGPHPKDDEAKAGTEKPLPPKKQRPSKNTE